MSKFILIAALAVVEQISLREYLLDGLTITYMLAFYIFSMLGMLLSMLLHFTGKAESYRATFRLVPFIKRNLARIVLPAVVVFVILRFQAQLDLDIAPGMYLGLLLGLGMDRAILWLRANLDREYFRK